MRLLPWRAPWPARDVTDRAVVERMASGDQTAVRELLARYRSTVYATAYAVLVEPGGVPPGLLDRAGVHGFGVVAIHPPAVRTRVVAASRSHALANSAD